MCSYPRAEMFEMRTEQLKEAIANTTTITLTIWEECKLQLELNGNWREALKPKFKAYLLFRPPSGRFLLLSEARYRGWVWAIILAETSMNHVKIRCDVLCIHGQLVLMARIPLIYSRRLSEAIVKQLPYRTKPRGCGSTRIASDWV